MDIKTLTQMSHEQKAYESWVKAEKSRIIKMTNATRRQEAWNKLFPQTVYSEEINSMIF